MLNNIYTYLTSGNEQKAKERIEEINEENDKQDNNEKEEQSFAQADFKSFSSNDSDGFLDFSMRKI